MRDRNKRAKNFEQADGGSSRECSYHRFIKKAKNRLERRRARENPDCIPGYGKYTSYEM